VTLCLIAGAGSGPLASALAAELGVELLPRTLDRFPDGEWDARIEAEVRGCDVYLVQPTGPPVHDQLVALLLLADASRRAGAARVTALIPYFGYARQDRRPAGGAVGARVVADAMTASAVDRVIVVDPHTPALEAMFSIPVEAVSAVPLLAAALRPVLPTDAVLVAPDLGAVKLAERYGELLALPVASVRKRRLSGEHVEAGQISGAVGGHAPVVVDDMISTGGTIEAAVRAALGAGARPEVVVAASHGLFVGPAVERLRALPIRRLLVTDSLGTPPDAELPIEVVRVAPLLAEAIRR
jgi:ribose-phosphate pyrophosphokinase